MKVIVYLLAFGNIAIGSCLILYTRATVDAVKALYQRFTLRNLSAIPAVFGLLFLISASATTHPWVLRIVGLLAIAEAVVAFTDPQKFYTRMLNWYFENASDQAQRLFGIIAIIFGTVMLSWVT